MAMKKIEVSEALNVELDYLVAMCEGINATKLYRPIHLDEVVDEIITRGL